MSLFLSKLVPLFFYPVGATLLLLVVALGLSFRRRALARVVAVLALVVLWVAATPAFSAWLAAQLEGRYPPRTVAELPSTDAIVLLGGFVGQASPSPAQPQLLNAGDRFVEALRLYRANKAPRVVISGGDLPWAQGAAPEAELIADLLMEFEVPRADLVVEGESRNTRENAVNTAQIFAANGWKTGLLVTSAMHMPRALATFQRAGLDLVPAPADIRSRLREQSDPFNFIPNADALQLTTTAMKEIVGGVYYRLRGWN